MTREAAGEATPSPTDPAPYFAAFREQSQRPDRFGKITWHYQLTPGLSGATAVLALRKAEPSEPIVLKWGPLEGIINEAATRSRRAADEAGRSREALEHLREVGASHVAIRQGDGEAYGIIAYRYEGSLTAEDGPRVGDFTKAIQESYVAREEITDFGLDMLYQNVVESIAPDLSTSRPEVTQHTAEIPDFERFVDRLDRARAVLESHDVASTVIDRVRDAWNASIKSQMTAAYQDSRTVHGDPRFANIIVNLRDNSVAFIDFGEGGPGRHVFNDLARFEIDVLLRTTAPAAAGDRLDEILARGRVLLDLEPITLDAPREVRAAAVWRARRNQQVTQIPVRRGVFELYAMFLVNELVRRIGWHAQRSADDVGGTIGELLAAIDLAREALEGRLHHAV
jgi:hypothetical protein